MNKLSKIFLAIIIVLVIALGIMTYLYFDLSDFNNKLMGVYEKAVTELYNEAKAMENAELKFDRQEDGSYVVVKREHPIERVED